MPPNVSDANVPGKGRVRRLRADEAQPRAGRGGYDEPRILPFQAPLLVSGPIGSYSPDDFKDRFPEDDLSPMALVGLTLELLAAGEEGIALLFRNQLLNDFSVDLRIGSWPEGRPAPGRGSA